MENPLLELQEYENLQEALKKAKGPVQATGTLDSQKVHLMYWLGKDGGFPWKLVVTYDDQRARESTMIFAALRKRMALPGKGSAVLQCGYPRKPDDPPAHCSVAAPDGRERRRGRHHAGRSYGSSPAFSIF